jgi:hypothetical protein
MKCYGLSHSRAARSCVDVTPVFGLWLLCPWDRCPCVAGRDFRSAASQALGPSEPNARSCGSPVSLGAPYDDSAIAGHQIALALTCLSTANYPLFFLFCVGINSLHKFVMQDKYGEVPIQWTNHSERVLVYGKRNRNLPEILRTIAVASSHGQIGDVAPLLPILLTMLARPPFASCSTKCSPPVPSGRWIDPRNTSSSCRFVAQAYCQPSTTLWSFPKIRNAAPVKMWKTDQH